MNKWELMRTAYNRLFYALVRVFTIGSDVELFPSANGWTFTFRKGMFVYKCFNLSFLVHSSGGFNNFIKTHHALLERDVGHLFPGFSIHPLCVRYSYIPDSRDLLRALAESSVAEREEILSRVVQAIMELHQGGVVHGDLKPKNILLDSTGKVYLIDIENATVTHDVEKRIIDFSKLLPRIVYLFTDEELQRVLLCYKEFHLYAARYLSRFDCRALMAGVPGVHFESENDSLSEDIDIGVDDYSMIRRLSEIFEARGLDVCTFHYSRNDIKLYVYNLTGIRTVDVHLKKELSRASFLVRRLYTNRARMVSLTGPDGSGKTTTLEAVSALAEHALLKDMPFNIMHATRFARDSIALSNRSALVERVLNRLSNQLYSRYVAFIRVLRTGAQPLFLFDRSFYDPFIQGSLFWYHSLVILRFILPRMPILLLELSSATILKRSSQLTEEEVDRYYSRFSRTVPVAARVDSTRSDAYITVYRIVQFVALTEQKFLNEFIQSSQNIRAPIKTRESD